MSPEAQRIAIAEACGWTLDANSQNGRWIPPGKKPLHAGYYTAKPPDYLNDLNAMHEAEKCLDDELTSQWADELAWVVHRYRLHMSANMMRATAAQRAEAFLRTLGKWTPQNHPLDPKKA